MPADTSILPLWKVVKEHLGLAPKSLEDDDLKKIFQGIGSPQARWRLSSVS